MKLRVSPPTSRLQKRSLLALVTLLLPQTTWAWGWWLLGSVAAGAAICVTGGAALVAIGGGLATGVVGTAAVGDSVYDDIASAPAHPVGGNVIFDRANPLPIVLPLYTDPMLPSSVVDDFNEGIQGLADSLQWGRGVRDSARRYYGAQAEGNAAAMALQKSYVDEFLLKAQNSSRIGVAGMRRFSDDYRMFYAPSDDTRTTATEYKNFRDSVIVDGCPECAKNLTITLNMTPDEADELTQYITSASDSDIDSFFSSYPAEGIYYADFLDEAMNQWEKRPYGSALSGPLVPEPGALAFGVIAATGLFGLMLRKNKSNA